MFSKINVLNYYMRCNKKPKNKPKNNNKNCLLYQLLAFYINFRIRYRAYVQTLRTDNDVNSLFRFSEAMKGEGQFGNRGRIC